MKTVTVVTELRAGGNEVGFNAAYPEGMDACLCSLVSDAGYKVNLIHTSPEHDGSALTDEILQETDVLIWWGHAFHHFVLDSVAERVAKSRTAVTNSMRLLKLNEKVQQMVIDEMLTTGHVRALLAIENKDNQYALAMQIFDQKLSVRETEKLIRNIVEPKVKKEKPVDMATAAIYESLEERMKNILGTKVSIHRRSKHKGQIEIEYYSEQELERLLDLIQTIQS